MINGEKEEIIVGQWLRTDETLSESSVRLVTRFILASSQFTHVRYEFCKQHGLNTSEFDVIATLYRAGDSHEVTAKELKEQTLLPSSGALSNRIERLESKNLVQRKHDTLDKRSVKISLTAEGEELVSQIYPKYFEVMSSQFASLNSNEIETLITLMSNMGSTKAILR
ncbi:MarR family winged helix-turn-helix transcriptional regulator [Vibrio mediterranei]